MGPHLGLAWQREANRVPTTANALYTIGGGCMVRQNTFPSVDSSM